MNALNLLSARVIGTPPLAPRPRSRSQGEGLRSSLTEELLRGRSFSADKVPTLSSNNTGVQQEPSSEDILSEPQTPISDVEDEKQPLLGQLAEKDGISFAKGPRRWIKKFADAITAILSTIGLPIVYVVQFFKDETGQYSLSVPFKRRRRKTPNASGPSSADRSLADSSDEQWSEKPPNRVLQETKLRHSYSSDSLNSATSDSETERRRQKKSQRKDSSSEVETNRPRRQSARIKLLQNDEATEKRNRRKTGLSDKHTDTDSAPLTVDNIKSPISATTALKLTRYPHTSLPPRPLIPRRQPSYSNLIPRSPSRAPSSSQQKTLILDLDETLIHSLAKGGRMSTGHMVEVKLNVPVALSPPQTGTSPPALVGPLHPILYYVHKRPHCDEFLRKICKWYKLVIFTASVQEYADPVIDWLEQERKYFHGRFYRQHCTFRNGSYIKDLSSIEPDLSKVMILDNSPVSYIFHEDNAIPIEGWINDPTDNDLLHLIPMLEALQYVTDVRALLALRRGEAEAT